MAALLLATDKKFWLKKYGSQKRIDSLCEILSKKNISISIFFIGELDDNDNSILANHNLGQKIFSTGALKRHNRFYTIKKIFSNFTKHISTNKRNTGFKNSSQKLDDFYSKKALKFFKKVCRDEKPRYILIEYIRLSYLLNNLSCSLEKSTIKLIDTHEVMHERANSFFLSGLQPGLDISENEEKRALSIFDIIIAIHKTDAKKLHRMLPNKKIVTAGFHHPIIKNNIKKSSSISIMYAAGTDISNQDALSNFLKQIWPALIEKYSKQIHLCVYGKICNFFNSIDENQVNFFGFIPDLEDAYLNTDIYINPVKAGSGLKIKNVEALCHGKPLVTTSIGAEGIEDGINKAFFICDTDKEQITTLSKLIENPELREFISQKAYNYAQRNFVPEIAYKELLDILDKTPDEIISEIKQQ